MPNPFMPLMPPDFFTNPLFSVPQNAATTVPHGMLKDSKNVIYEGRVAE